MRKWKVHAVTAAGVGLLVTAAQQINTAMVHQSCAAALGHGMAKQLIGRAMEVDADCIRFL